MTADLREEHLHRERKSAATRRNGLWIGSISGLTFGLTTWGIDAITLASASVDRPWFKLAAGLALSLVVGAIVGWLTAWIDRAPVGLLFWACVGIGYAWLVGHLPFDGQSALLRLIEPRLGDITAFPFVESARVRTAFLMFIVGGLCAIGGLLELALLDRASEPSTALGHAFSLGLTIPLFALAGFASDGIINRPLREPLVAVDRLIGWAREARSTPIDPALARQRHLGALGGLEDVIDRPYRISLGAYDSGSLMSFSVEVDFDGTWVRCSVLASSPSYCLDTNSVYQNALICLLRGSQECDVDAADTVRPWIDQAIARNDSPASISVLNHFGSVVLVDVAWADGQQDVCLFRGIDTIVLSRCIPGEGT